MPLQRLKAPRVARFGGGPEIVSEKPGKLPPLSPMSCHIILENVLVSIALSMVGVKGREPEFCGREQVDDQHSTCLARDAVAANTG